ncbi:MAG: dual specificity protein phosphatase family protein, partial [Planctomycetaceae bacterium]|nr:dual specificity protein phosphatase family protein [Planctomycetaceae bacterium]
DRMDFPEEIDRKMHILVHCAQGRGRSAIMTCMVLCRLGHALNGEEAFRMLKQTRPRVSVSKMQMKQIAQIGVMKRP